MRIGIDRVSQYKSQIIAILGFDLIQKLRLGNQRLMRDIVSDQILGKAEFASLDRALLTADHHVILPEPPELRVLPKSAMDKVKV